MKLSAVNISVVAEEAPVNKILKYSQFKVVSAFIKVAAPKVIVSLVPVASYKHPFLYVAGVLFVKVGVTLIQSSIQKLVAVGVV